MCIIKIFKDSSISDNEIDKLWSQNSDGGGIGYIDKELNLHIPIRTDDLALFKKELQELLRNKNYETLVIHLRNRSKGSVDFVNINPIYIDKETIMFHNGTFHRYENNYYSDSIQFVFDEIHKFKNFDIENESQIEQIKNKVLNNRSRLVFLQQGKKNPLIIDNFDIGYWLHEGKQWTSK